MLTKRWTQLRKHDEQQRLWNSPARFRVVPAGRRSGKTEFAKRFLIRGCPEQGLEGFLTCTRPDGWFVASAPTHAQAKRIYWRDLKSLVPKPFIRRISESELAIDAWNGARLQVMGMDAPERIEGPPLDGIVLDEYANMKEAVWDEHVGPALSTPGRPGWAWFIGVPEAGGANDYEDLFDKSQSDLQGWDDWDGFTWESADILDEAEIERARERMDPRSFDQEFRAKFVNVGGRTYYSYGDDNRRSVPYDPKAELLLTLDFNVEPGTASVLQRFRRPEGWPSFYAPELCGAIGEVWINHDSNTERVCKELVARWGKHQGRVVLYGDASGGARSTTSDENDWDVVRRVLKPAFGSQLLFKVPKANPAERARINAMNSRIRTADGIVHFVIDVGECPHLDHDFKRVTSLPDGSINKRIDPKLTHPTDGVGYWAVFDHPLRKRGFKVERGY